MGKSLANSNHFDKASFKHLHSLSLMKKGDNLEHNTERHENQNFRPKYEEYIIKSSFFHVTQVCPIDQIPNTI
jgi:hypothetical protein